MRNFFQVKTLHQVMELIPDFFSVGIEELPVSRVQAYQSQVHLRRNLVCLFPLHEALEQVLL